MGNPIIWIIRFETSIGKWIPTQLIWDRLFIFSLIQVRQVSRIWIIETLPWWTKWRRCWTSGWRRALMGSVVFHIDLWSSPIQLSDQISHLYKSCKHNFCLWDLLIYEWLWFWWLDDNNNRVHDHCNDQRHHHNHEHHNDYLEVRMDAVSHLVEDLQLRDEPMSGETDDHLDWRSASPSYMIF